MNRIKCFIDPLVDPDSKCANCCVYCDEKMKCEYSCPIAQKHDDDNGIYNSECIYV